MKLRDKNRLKGIFSILFRITIVLPILMSLKSSLHGFQYFWHIWFYFAATMAAVFVGLLIYDAGKAVDDAPFSVAAVGRACVKPGLFLMAVVGIVIVGRLVG